jgi:peptide/nickel transport system substrate-binding protein
VLARRAVQMVVNQEDYMRAIVGDDNSLWSPCHSFITPNTPLYTEVGSEPMKAKRDFDAAKKLLAESGYKGEKVTCVVGQDLAPVKAMGEITADLLKRLGMNVDFVATDWGTVGQRRASKNPPDQGGWAMFHTWHAGADCVNPASYTAIRANGDKAWFGWPSNDAVEKEVVNWFDAKNAAEEKAAIDRLNKAAMDHVVYVPTGLFRSYQAWRSNVEGVGPGPLPFFWNVKKS